MTHLNTMNILWLSCTAKKNPRTPLHFPLFFGFFWRPHSHFFHIWSFIVCHRIKYNFLFVGLKCLLLDDYFFTGKEPRCSMVFYGQNVCYQLVIERLTKLVAILKVNCDSMIRWEFHPIQRMIYRGPLEFVEKNIYLCINFCLALHVSNPLRELLLQVPLCMLPSCFWH